MAGSENISIEMDTDFSKIESAVLDISTGFKEMRTVLRTLNNTVASGMSTNLHAIQQVEAGIGRLGEATPKTSFEEHERTFTINYTCLR